MSYTEVFNKSAAQAEIQERNIFIKKTYQHLALAILAFVGIEYLIVVSGLAEAMANLIFNIKYSWLIVLGLFMGVSYFANKMARGTTSKTSQYTGLSLYVVAEAIIFAPLIWIASEFAGSSVLSTAVVLTLFMFGGLTSLALLTKTDYSFLKGFLTVGGFVAIGLILAGILFGFELGLWFSGAMIVFASGSILYETSNIAKYYRTDQYVSAALSLFASVALLFWYILNFLLSMNND